jgi:hypothetical protein
MRMIPVLIAAIVVLGTSTLYAAVRSREFRRFLAGAFFVSAGIQFYFYLAKVSIPPFGDEHCPDTSSVAGKWLNRVCWLLIPRAGCALHVRHVEALVSEPTRNVTHVRLYFIQFCRILHDLLAGRLHHKARTPL